MKDTLRWSGLSLKNKHGLGGGLVSLGQRRRDERVREEEREEVRERRRESGLFILWKNKWVCFNSAV